MRLGSLAAKIASLDVSIGDEVSGSLGPWVFLDSKDLRDLYPEIYKEINKEKVFESDHSTLLSDQYETKRRRSKGSKSGPLVLLMLICLVAGAGFLLQKKGAFKAVLQSLDTSPPTDRQTFLGKETLDAAIESSDPESLKRFFAKVNLEKISSGELENYLPYLRFVAFTEMKNSKFGRGHHEALTISSMQGPSGERLAGDCRVDSWKKALADAFEKGLSSNNYGRFFMKESKLRAALWHPGWISLRQSPGWIYPYNYAHACLLSANQALFEIATGLDTAFLQKRINWQISNIEQIDFDFGMPEGVLGALTCVENGPESGKCYKESQYSANEVKILNRQKILHEVYLSVSTNSVQVGSSDIPLTDPVSGLDYRIEKSVIMLMKKGHTPQHAIELLQKKHLELVY